MNKYPKKRQTNGYFVHICKSITAKRKIIRLRLIFHSQPIGFPFFSKRNEAWLKDDRNNFQFIII